MAREDGERSDVEGAFRCRNVDLIWGSEGSYEGVSNEGRNGVSKLGC